MKRGSCKNCTHYNNNIMGKCNSKMSHKSYKFMVKEAINNNKTFSTLDEAIAEICPHEEENFWENV